MPIPTTRRDFIRLSAAGLAALSQPLSGLAQTPGPIEVQQSAGAKRFAPESDLRWAAGACRLVARS